ncbi:MAG: xanthine dehydrogenase family protein molybdopterin-binding subunit [Candidatus Hydrogenedentes bacterium]|nr:xanthine dehydrogenase family protein molybdopterin-binding subunit [Candidatus Hydrogenedentota bacterium]
MMANPQWPAAEQRQHLGKRISRLDGPVKCTGAAKYTYDIHRDGLLYAKLVGSRIAAGIVNSIDTSAAEKLPGVQGVWKDESLIGKEVQYAGQILAAVAARTEEIADEAARLVKVEYTPATPQVDDTDPARADGKPATREEGDVATALSQAATVFEGAYGLPVVCHCCLEAHGQVSEAKNGEMYLWGSTQSVSSYAKGLHEDVGLTLDKMHVECQYIGGGFGSKFSYDKWGVISAKLAQLTGMPVKLMLDRDLELMVAGNRPSASAKLKVGLDGNGKITAFDAEVWGTGGKDGYKPPPMPYVFTKIPNHRENGLRIPTNRGSQRAWRAPGHPQGCLLTMAALDDAAAAIKMDALEFFKKNLDLTERREVYAAQLDIAADLINYKEKAHLRGESGPGPLKRGLGISLHQWGGMGHPSECDVTINPEGSVETKIGTQDLGTGTRTTVTIVVAETLGLPLEGVTLKMGKNEYPASGASGGSTTIGGVSASSRLAATAALNALLEVVAPKLGATPDQLEARDGQIRAVGDANKTIAWKDACSLLGTQSITKRGTNVPGESQKMGLIDGGVGGVQIAEVTVDTETGCVTMNEMVAVQDCGLIVDLKTAESQVHSGLIMGITYALYEEAVYDPTTGRMLNADMEFYRLAGIKDVGQFKVHMMTGAGYDERGVIGLGEPPVISPGAAISSAVANAIGVRVPRLPLTPDRVLMALQQGTGQDAPTTNGGLA